MADKFHREDALAALAVLSLLRQEDGPGGSILIFHRLLLDVTRDWIGTDARDLWGTVAVKMVNRAFAAGSDGLGDPSTDTSRWPLFARLMSHVAPLESYAPRTGPAGIYLDRLLNQAGLYLGARGDHAGALIMIENSVSLKRQTRAGDQLELAAGLGNLGVRYADLNRLDDAEAAYREALAIQEPRLDANSPTFATTVSNLANLHWTRNEFAKAEPLYLRAIS